MCMAAVFPNLVSTLFSTACCSCLQTVERLSRPGLQDTVNVCLAVRSKYMCFPVFG